MIWNSQQKAVDPGGASWCVFADNPVDPFDIVPDFGVDSREVWVGTTDSPGNNALKVTIADEGTTGITLWIKRTYHNALVKGNSKKLQLQFLTVSKNVQGNKDYCACMY